MHPVGIQGLAFFFFLFLWSRCIFYEVTGGCAEPRDSPFSLFDFDLLGRSEVFRHFFVFPAKRDHGVRLSSVEKVTLFI